MSRHSRPLPAGGGRTDDVNARHARNGAGLTLGLRLSDGLVATGDWLVQFAKGSPDMARWSCDLTTGVYTLSPAAADMHRLAPGARGIMDIVSAYDPAQHEIVLATLERATGHAMLFGYAARLAGPAPAPRIVCIGRSITGASGYPTILHGLFSPQDVHASAI